MKRFLCSLLLPMMTFAAAPAAASDPVIPPADDSVAARVIPVTEPMTMPPAVLMLHVHTTRSGGLIASYVTHAALQGFDAYSTLRAVQSGASERNPLMRGVVGSPAAFVAVKGAVAATTILAAEHMWRTGHRRRAIALMAITNGVFAMVAVNNAVVLTR